MPVIAAGRRRAPATAAVLWTLVAGLMGLYLTVFAMVAYSRLLRPLEELAYGESWVLDGARSVARGEALYAPADRLPLTQTPYTPAYYMLVGALQRDLGDHGYTVGRAVSLGAALGAALLLAWPVRRLTGCWKPGLLAAGLFATQNLTVLQWASLHRVDVLALAFSLAGLALATVGHPYMAVVPFLVAFMTKQTFVVAPLAVCLSLWPCWRRMMGFAALVAVGVTLSVLAAQWLTDRWFLWHAVVANANEADFLTFATLMGAFLQINGLPVLAAVATLPLGSHPGERLWRLYFLGSLVTLLSIAKIGASSNYWLELSAAVAVLLAFTSHHLARRAEARMVAPTVLAGILLIALPGYQANAVEAADVLRDVRRPPSPAYLSLVADTDTRPYRVDARFVSLLANEPGELLTDNSGLAVAAGKRIAFEFQIFQLLEAEGHWSDEPLLEAIAARQFALVVLMHPLDGPVEGTRWTPAVRNALLTAYAPAGEQAGFWLYRPMTDPAISRRTALTPF